MRERNTIQKTLVLEAAKKLNHPTAEQVYAFVQTVSPHISRATVYRNLGNRVESGELRRVPVADGADHFDHRTDDHYHVRCKECGMLADVQLSSQAGLMDGVEDTGGFRIDSYEILFEGLCATCQNARQANHV